MFLNDAFDEEFDRKFRPERPIPAGKIASKTVVFLGGAWLVLGCVTMFCAGIPAGALGIALAACIVVYNAFHKRVPLVPVIMGLCRFFVYLAAAASAAGGLSTAVIIGGAAVCLYIIGLTYIARRESTGGALSFSPVALLFAPIVVAFCRNGAGYRDRAMLLCLVPLLWMARNLRYALSRERDIGRTVSGLLAGIVLIDWLAVANAPREVGAAFIALFVLSLALQKWVPAT
jgi:4-hydroxybenzoate polyprenyltransferase